MPSFLAQTCDELTEAGLLSLAEDAWGMLRLGISDTGRNRYAQLNALGPVARPGRPAPSADAAPAPSGVKVRESVLAPVPGVRYECAQAPGQDSGPDPTPCTDAEKTISW